MNTAYVAGLMDGLTGQDHTKDWQKCFGSAADYTSEWRESMSLIMQEDYITGFQNMPVGSLDSVADECAWLQDEITAVSTWGWIFVRPVYLGAEITKHWI